jgi:uncharacterized protein (DUF1697 family)
MTRYAAFLRGVMPGKPPMSELKEAFEKAGFSDVKTLLSSGNVVFASAAASEATLERKAEAAMKKVLGKEYMTIVRTIDSLRALIEADPWRAFRLAPESKRVVTFLRRHPAAKLKLPIEVDGARIVAMRDRDVFTAYTRTPNGPVFMSLIEKTFGKDVTTRTWETVGKVAR